MTGFRVTIVDYGLGNLYSVGRALEVCGAEVMMASTATQIESAHHLVLPGVGAFEMGMAGLRDRGLIDPIRRHATEGKPLLGICLGMQMLASIGEEFGEHVGLNLIPGRVRALPTTGVDGEPLKVPRIGWRALQRPPSANWKSSPLDDVEEGESVYLVHSYAMIPDDSQDCLAVSDFGGHAVCTVIRRGALVGCQFHPEKSGPSGLKVIAQFIAR